MGKPVAFVGLLALAVVGWTLTRLLDTNTTLQVVKPDWMEPGATQIQARTTAPERSQVHPDADAEEQAPIALQTPPEALSAALLESKARVRFEVTAPLAERLTLEVANQVVEAVTAQWPIYQSMLRGPEAERSDDVARNNLFFAIWPDLPQLITEKRARLEVTRKPSSPPRSSAMTFTTSRPDRTIEINLLTQDWVVGIDFDAKSFRDSAHEPLWDRIFHLMDERNNRR
jgi:hypothetical protein